MIFIELWRIVFIGLQTESCLPGHTVAETDDLDRIRLITVFKQDLERKPAHVFIIFFSRYITGEAADKQKNDNQFYEFSHGKIHLHYIIRKKS